MRSSALSLAALSAAIGTQAKLADSYSKMVVFGASYFDSAHKDPSSMTSRFAGDGYFQGRFTNGPVVPEHLADLYSLKGDAFVDWAFAGAVTSNKLTPDLTSVFDIGTQVSTFEKTLGGGGKVKRSPDLELSLQAHSRGAHAGHALSSRDMHHNEKRYADSIVVGADGSVTANGTVTVDHPKGAGHHGNSNGNGGSSGNGTTNGGGDEPAMLVVVEVGLNTLKALLEEGKTSEIGSNVDALGDALTAITKSGPIRSLSSNKKMDLLVMPMFPLDKIPNWSQNGVDLNAVQKGVSQWNSALDGHLSKLSKAADGDRIITWDAAQFWSKPDAYGVKFTDTTNACYKGEGSPCGEEDTFFYWDSVHITTKAMLAFAKSLKADSVTV